MGTNAVMRGTTGRAVAANVKAIRERRGWSQQQLAAELSRIGRPIQPSGIAKVEAGDRRVDVDDLVALAVALNVSPPRLIFGDVDMDAQVELTPAVEAPGWAVWQWLTSYRPLQPEGYDLRDANVQARILEYLAERPTWLRALETAPLSQAVQHLAHTATLALRSMQERPTDSPATPARLRLVRRALESVDNELTELEAETDDAR